MAQFIDSEVVDKEPLILDGCDIVPDLNGMSFNRLPLTLRLQVKRSGVRALIIKRQSRAFLRYEMFKRLNTGGSELSEQEIRNCSARIFGEEGVRFYEFLVQLSQFPTFKSLTETLADSDQEKRGREELVLRFFAAKNGSAYYHGNVSEWLNNYMEAVLLKQTIFDYESEETLFGRVFNAVDRVAGDGAFCKYKNGRPIGGLAPAYYEAIVCAFARQLDKVESAEPTPLNSALISARESERFKSNVGTGANKRSKLIGRVAVIEEAINGV